MYKIIYIQIIKDQCKAWSIISLSVITTGFDLKKNGHSSNYHKVKIL